MHVSTGSGGLSDTVSLKEAARRLGISHATAWRLVQKDEFPLTTLKIGKSFKVSRKALDRLLTTLEGTEAAS